MEQAGAGRVRTGPPAARALEVRQPHLLLGALPVAVRDGAGRTYSHLQQQRNIGERPARTDDAQTTAITSSPAAPSFSPPPPPSLPPPPPPPPPLFPPTSAPRALQPARSPASSPGLRCDRPAPEPASATCNRGASAVMQPEEHHRGRPWADDGAMDDPPIMSATSGPMDHDEFYWSSPHGSYTPPDESLHPPPSIESTRSVSMSPARKQSPGPAAPSAGASVGHTLSSVRSTPALLPSRPAGSVKNMANRFDRVGVPASDGQARRRLARGSSRSPTRRSSPTKPHKRRPVRPRSPARSTSANTSFDTSSSFSSSAATVTSARSQPASAITPRSHMTSKSGPHADSRPLFGELMPDGMWNGNFDLGHYGSPPTTERVQRRGSDGSIAIGRGSILPRPDIPQPATLGPLPQSRQLGHKRSRSDMDALQSRGAPHTSSFNSDGSPAVYPTPPPSGTRMPPHKDSPISRIPVSRSRPPTATSPGVHSRSASAMSYHGNRHRQSRSPTRKPLTGKENGSPSTAPRSRYDPPPQTATPNGQTLSAKIVAPLPKTSPPLRSSRPRQPVNSATTSASRARAADRFPSESRDGRRPSEQWLGKPYDPQHERSKRKIPQLGKVDFAERRARIQKAISQNLEESRSRESLRGRSRSANNSSENEKQQQPHQQHDDDQSDTPVAEDVHQQQQQHVSHQTPPLDQLPDAMPGGWPTPGGGRSWLSVDTHHVQDRVEHDAEPATAHTEFEDESPILGRAPNQTTPTSNEQSVEEEPPTLLTSATYRPPPSKVSAPPPPSQDQENAQSPTVLENVMQIRHRSPSSSRTPGTGFADGGASAEDSPSDIEDRWGLGRGLAGDQGSIKIMLDKETPLTHHAEPWAQYPRGAFEPAHGHLRDGEATGSQNYDRHDSAANGYTESPVDNDDEQIDGDVPHTPRKNMARDSTPASAAARSTTPFTPKREDLGSEDGIARAITKYQATGIIPADMLEEMQKHMVDLQRISANGGSNGFMVQNLLDSVLSIEAHSGGAGLRDTAPEELQSSAYQMPEVTPNTPPGWQKDAESGTVVVYTNQSDRPPETPTADGEHEDFEDKIRKADEAWERQQRGEDAVLGVGEEDRPPPPPKDEGYTPRSSVGPNNSTIASDLARDFRLSVAGRSDMSERRSAGDDAEADPMTDAQASSFTLSPPPPVHAPPPPPPPPVATSASATTSATRLPLDMPERPQMHTAYSERASSEMSPRMSKTAFGVSWSSRPSIDSQRTPYPPPASVSRSSFADSATGQTSLDINADGQPRPNKGSSPGPEQKRLLKRRHIIKELLDTENTYHQDLKIIEDIYKATATLDLVGPEDKKILFGNCDEIERFSLHFYDDLRKAVVPVYVPAKQMRWVNKRGSFSTTQSDGATQASSTTSEGVDDEKDRATTVGQAFLQNLQRMENVYSAYLKNHDAANQRLSALRNTPTVKCWLDECHANASDITSAWDLDSLLVKPTQRVAKYPMLLQQLLETTPQDHADREALSSAAKDSVSMLMRINEAKKRADLVDRIVNGKHKDTDVRSGIAKAFGRRTEKLKERVGIAEAFQDPDFDELAHKFGGHFIRLQICMRDVQDYMHRVGKAVEQINNFAGALDLFTDVGTNSDLIELQSKWRKYGQAVRDVTAVAFADHKAAVNKRVIAPMIACIKLHEGPQNAIAKRKKRIVDYAKCKSIEKRGEKPDRKTVEASEMYMALNDQLKIDLPKLYSLTASLVQGCLNCFLQIQLTWNDAWERKLRPVLEAADIPESIQQIEPAFRPDFDLVKYKILELGVCNGAVLAESANFLSPSMDSDSAKRTTDGSQRTQSMGSETSTVPGSAAHKRRSSGYVFGAEVFPMTYDSRGRSNSSMSVRGQSSTTLTTGAATSANRPWSNSHNNGNSIGTGNNGKTRTSSFSASRPTTANTHSGQQQQQPHGAGFMPPRTSMDQVRSSPRPASGATYFTARPDMVDNQRYSDVFSSALPPSDSPDFNQPNTPKMATEDTRVLFVCASLFQFNIDRTRKEAGYPYLTYGSGEIFDVVAQKGELWLAKNQDDRSNNLGWIWEQHFVILQQV